MKKQNFYIYWYKNNRPFCMLIMRFLSKVVWYLNLFNKRRRNILGGSFKNSNYLNDPNKIVYCIFVNLKFWCCHFKKSYGKGNIAINFQIFKMCRTFYAHTQNTQLKHVIFAYLRHSPIQNKINWILNRAIHISKTALWIWSETKRKHKK